MLTEKLLDITPDILAELTNLGIEVDPATERNGTTHGLFSSIPELYQHVAPPPPRKFLSFKIKYKGRLAFMKLLLDPAAAMVAQLERDALAGIELTRHAPQNVICPIVIDYIRSGSVNCVIYSHLPEDYGVLKVPFFPGIKRAISFEDAVLAKKIAEDFYGWGDINYQDFSPSPEFMQMGGFDVDTLYLIRPWQYTLPKSIRNPSGMPTYNYLSELRALLTAPTYSLVEQTDKGNFLQSYSLNNVAASYLEKSQNLFIEAMILLENYDFVPYLGNYTFVHADLGPQNIMVSGQRTDNPTAFVDMENITVAANTPLGKTADIAHLTSRLWYNEYWRQILLNAVLNSQKPRIEQIAFLCNLVLESLRRLTRPINYYAEGESIYGKQFAFEMIEYSHVRFEANLRLWQIAVCELEQLLTGAEIRA